MRPPQTQSERIGPRPHPSYRFCLWLLCGPGESWPTKPSGRKDVTFTMNRGWKYKENHILLFTDFTCEAPCQCILCRQSGTSPCTSMQVHICVGCVCAYKHIHAPDWCITSSSVIKINKLKQPCSILIASASLLAHLSVSACNTHNGTGPEPLDPYALIAPPSLDLWSRSLWYTASLLNWDVGKYSSNDPEFSRHHWKWRGKKNQSSFFSLFALRWLY